MNRTPRLGKSGIEYLNYVWNFYSGCQNKEAGICHVQRCWAEGITKRMGHNYPTGFKPAFYPEAFVSPVHLKKPSIIGCAFMGDLFGDWVNPDEKFHATMPSGKASITMSLKGWVFTTIRQCPQHTFLFLTKCPWNLPKWSPFPDNCYVGATATGIEAYKRALAGLAVIEAKVKYLSIEPFLERIPMAAPYELDKDEVQQVIIGAQTKPTVYPKIEWVEEIVRACDKAGVPVFIKNNLKPVMRNSAWRIRQEMPTMSPHQSIM